jgi:hypothetical protein
MSAGRLPRPVSVSKLRAGRVQPRAGHHASRHSNPYNRARLIRRLSATPSRGQTVPPAH